MLTSITTERLLLDRLAIGDGKFILELVNTDGWLRFIGNRKINSEADATAYIQTLIENPNINYWVARLQGTDTAIGIITFIKREVLAYHDIGFALLPAYERKGYAYEAARAILFGIAHSAKHTHVSGITNVNNGAAIKLLKKLGFEFQNWISVENENMAVYEASVNKLCITEITNKFFSAFTNRGNEPPKLDLLKEIFIPEAMITNNNRSTTDIFNLSSFIDKRKKILTDGTLVEFEEKEIFEETKIIENIATRFSEYEKKGFVFRKRFQLKGYKLFQFVKIKQSWKICSVLWIDNEN